MPRVARWPGHPVKGRAAVPAKQLGDGALVLQHEAWRDDLADLAPFPTIGNGLTQWWRSVREVYLDADKRRRQQILAEAGRIRMAERIARREVLAAM
jgi:hypothetical protein